MFLLVFYTFWPGNMFFYVILDLMYCKDLVADERMNVGWITEQVLAFYVAY